MQQICYNIHEYKPKISDKSCGVQEDGSTHIAGFVHIDNIFVQVISTKTLLTHVRNKNFCCPEDVQVGSKQALHTSYLFNT